MLQGFIGSYVRVWFDAVGALGGVASTPLNLKTLAGE